MQALKTLAILIPTPLGMMWGLANEESILGLGYMANAVPIKLKHTRQQVAGNTWVWTQQVAQTHPLALLASQLTEYFVGERQSFDLPLSSPGTEFQQDSWRALQKIGYGKTCCYQEQAQRLGKPKATRAVANANRLNPWSIIVPCHRVIGRNGQLTGYAGGLWRKRWLLQFESKGAFKK